MADEMNFNRLVPYLTVTDGEAAIAFYEKAFGGVCDVKMDAAEQMGPDFAGKILHASIRLNGGYLMLSDEFPGMEGAGDDSTGGTKNPLALGGSPVTLHLEVEDTRTLWERAVAAGASVIMPLANQFWEASYGKLRDPFGHVWSIGGPKMPE